MEQLFSCRTGSVYYSYSQAYFRKLVQKKIVPTVKIGYSIRFKKSDLDAHFEAKRSK